jgi:hypothetical protein
MVMVLDTQGKLAFPSAEYYGTLLPENTDEAIALYSLNAYGNEKSGDGMIAMMNGEQPNDGLILFPFNGVVDMSWTRDGKDTGNNPLYQLLGLDLSRVVQDCHY